MFQCKGFYNLIVWDGHTRFAQNRFTTYAFRWGLNILPVPKNIRVCRSDFLFIFLSAFYMLILRQNCFLGLSFQQNYCKFTYT